MKLHGRITFFGEYLLKENLSYCLCVKSKLFLTNETKYKHIEHPTYSQSKDATIPILKQYGLKFFSDIFGNLPLGYGLSSSTILSLLHLNSAHRRDLVVAIDKEMCGFSPSELDFTSITKQENGIWGFGQWHPLHNFTPFYSLLILPKEKRRTLPEIKTDLITSQKRQVELTKELFRTLSLTGELDFNLLFEYCKLLLASKVYSESATDVAKSLIDKGILCKSIGGLYDKALLVIHTDNTSKEICDKYVSENFGFLSIAE